MTMKNELGRQIKDEKSEQSYIAFLKQISFIENIKAYSSILLKITKKGVEYFLNGQSIKKIEENFEDHVRIFLKGDSDMGISIHKTQEGEKIIEEEKIEICFWP